MGIQEMSRCLLCKHYLPNGKEGRAAHMRMYHGVTIVQEIKPLAKEQMAKVICRVHERLGRHNFIVPEGAPAPVNKKLCSRCGWTENDGYWLTNGTGICEPCVKLDASTAQTSEGVCFRD